MTDISRKLHNLLALGTIAEVEPSSARLRVEINGRVTAWLPWPTEIGRNFRRWRPLRVGTQVLVACPAGDPANAVIVQIIYTDALPPPETSEDIDIISFEDGTVLKYDSAAHALTIDATKDVTINAAGAATVAATGPVTVTSEDTATIEAPAVAITGRGGASGQAAMVGDFTLTGSLTVQGNINATGSVMDGGGNTNHHTH